ncbi:diadenylate cyclase CdaA [uncultured Mailhella sp.]|uniref:diadenylate cyclase CdaA n=1 Tax=uncultured Mailhella sp. TaxID=1981031 RepID=UPI00260A1FB8|nr:diadenylate cyclase CdaA [uncultured Mailhella sp.]
MFSLGQLTFGWRDLLDILIVSTLCYYGIRFVRGTRAVAALNGLFVLLALYAAAQMLGLFTLVWLLQNVFSSLFLVVVILFHTDIRQALSNMNLRMLFRRHSNTRLGIIDTLSETASALAAKHIGAIIVIERSVSLGDMMEKGVGIDAVVSQDLLATIFFPNTALHDGAVIIGRDNRIKAAGCVLPLANVARQHFGTRHRAALGISEASDAVAIVVSEERGEVTIAQDGRLSNPLNQERLKRILTNALSQ